MTKRTLGAVLDKACEEYRNRKGSQGGTGHEFREYIMRDKKRYVAHVDDDLIDELLNGSISIAWGKRPRKVGPDLVLLHGDKKPLESYMTIKAETATGEIEYRKVSTKHALVRQIGPKGGDAEVQKDNVEDCVASLQERLAQYERAFKLAGKDDNMPLIDPRISRLTK